MNDPDGTGEPDEVEPQGADRTRVILLVEDDESDRHLYGHLLWYNGYSVLHAPDGESAVTMALDARPDLILLDMMLAGEMTGLDVAVRLRDEGFDVPMIALSAVKREEFGAALDEAGITTYIEKPVDPFAVVREVLRHVGGATPRHPAEAADEEI